MRVLCIVSCGNRKIWDKNPNAGPQRAKNVYIGPFASKCREYAERFFPSSWVILSAKYGFLFPDDVISGPYNVSFNDKNTDPVTVKELRSQAKDKGLCNYERIVVLGGKNYTQIIKDIFQNREIHDPLIDCKGIGYMMGKLNEAIKRGVPL